MNFKREIEKKFTVNGGFTFGDLDRFLSLFLPNAEKEVGYSQDMFWEGPNIDFIRLRENTKELTVKITDGDSIVNRVEENLIVQNLEDAKRWATAVFGPSTGTLKKVFNVYYDTSFIVSLYQVEGFPALFLEVESDSLQVVNDVSGALQQMYDLEQQQYSLYDICIKGQKNG